MMENVTPALIDKHLREMGVSPESNIDPTEEMLARLQPILGWANNPALSPRARMEQEKRLRREIANSNERRRMQSINAGFQSLKNLLPKRDGEKMSKASILQQTSQFIRSLQAEKAQLVQQNLQYKQLLELRGLVAPAPQAQGQQGQQQSQTNGQKNNLSSPIPPPPSQNGELTPPHSQDDALQSQIPLKKRKRIEQKELSVDEGIQLSDADNSSPASSATTDSQKSTPPESRKISNPAIVTPAQVAAIVSNGHHPPTWELDHMRRELRELRLAFEQERRARVVLEDHVRRDEQSKQLLTRLCTPVQPFAQPNPFPPPLLDYTAALHAQTSGLLSIPTPTRPVISLHGLRPPPLPTFPAVSNAMMAAQSLIHSSPVSSATLPLPLQPAGSPPTSTTGYTKHSVASLVRPDSDPTANPRNLESIVEAIRHLEGDQMFVEKSGATTSAAADSTGDEEKFADIKRPGIIVSG